MKATARVLAGLASAVSVAMARAETLVYAAGDESLGDGVVTFAYLDGAVAAMTVRPAGGTFVMTGDDIPFSQDPTVSLGGGTLVVSNGFSGAVGTMRIVNDGALETLGLDIPYVGEGGSTSINTDRSFLFRRNMRLSSVTNITSTLVYYSPYPGETFFFENDGTTAHCFVEGVRDGRTFGVEVSMYQIGADVYLQTNNSYNGKDSDWNDIVEYPHVFKAGDATGSPTYLYCSSLVVHCSEEPSVPEPVALVLAGANASAGGKVVVDGVETGAEFTVSAENVGAFPANGQVDVFGSSTFLDFNTGSYASGVSPSTVFNVHTGSVMRTLRDFAISHTGPAVVLTGGTLLHGKTTGSYQWGNAIYLNDITFVDGATLARNVGGKNLIAWQRDCNWLVRGNVPSRVEELEFNFGVWGDYSKFRLDVDDVTGDADVDVYFDMTLNPDASGKYGAFCKTGSGTVRATRPIRFIEVGNSIEAGTFLLGASGVFMEDARPVVIMNGGTLASDVTCTNHVGGLFLYADATLSLAEGAMLSCTDVVYLGDRGDLSLTLGENAVFNIGDAATLTKPHLEHISVNGGRAKQLADGRIVAKSVGMNLIIR